MKTDRIVLVCGVAAALGIRMALLWSAGDRYWERYEIRYDEVARNLVSGKGFAETGVMDLNISELTGTGPFLAPRPPLYPALLAGIYATLGRHPWSVGGVQALLSVATGLLCFVAARRVFGEREGLAAALLSLFYPYHIYHDLWLGDAAVAGFVLMLWLTLTWSYGRRARPALAVAIGVVLGLAMLVRPAYVLLLLATGVWLKWGLRLTWPRAVARGALIAAVAGGVLVPWTVRNYRVLGRVVPVCTYGGYAFWVGNNPVTEHCLRTGIEVDQPVRVLLSLIGDSLRGLDELEQQRWFYREGLAFVTQEPLAFIRLIPWKVWRFWGWDVYPKPEQTLRTVVHAAAYVPLAALAVLGTARAFRRKRKELILLLVLYASLTLFHCVFYSYTRYRKPFDHTLAVLAGHGLWVAVRRRVGDDPGSNGKTR